MPRPAIIDKLTSNSDIVICDNDISLQTHKELFSFKDDAYIKLHLTNANSYQLYHKIEPSDVFFYTFMEILDSLNLVPDTHPFRIHCVVNWEHLIQVALWDLQTPTPKEVIEIISTTGLGDNELRHINSLNVNEIFKYLLYEIKRFDIFRKICHYAKRQIRIRLANKSNWVSCYLASSSTKTIVASSL